MKRSTELIQSDDFLERIDAIEELSANIDDAEISDLIIGCFKDKNYLVRCEAYDAFHENSNRTIFSILLNRVKKERSMCARMHLISTLCGMAKKIGYNQLEKDYILKYYKKEKMDSVLIAYECLLYVYDKRIDHIYKVLSFLDSEKYKIRCNVINILSDVVDDSNISIIKNKYCEKVKCEDSYAVKSLLESELSFM